MKNDSFIYIGIAGAVVALLVGVGFYKSNGDKVAPSDTYDKFDPNGEYVKGGRAPKKTRNNRKNKNKSVKNNKP
jgi:hypothetical protein